MNELCNCRKELSKQSALYDYKQMIAFRKEYDEANPIDSSIKIVQ